jgi:hypothetical protein
VVAVDSADHAVNSAVAEAVEVVMIAVAVVATVVVAAAEAVANSAAANPCSRFLQNRAL